MLDKLNKWNRFRQLPLLEIKLFIKGFFLMHLFSLLNRFISIKSIEKIISSNNRILIERNSKIRISIHKTIKRINKYQLWDISCLSKSMTIKWLYNCFGIKSKLLLCLKKTEILEAHAFIEVDNFFTYLKLKDFQVLYSIE